jgi:hypothetical protein
MLRARPDGAFEAQRRFVANASHELRTPLTMMRTALDVATGKPGGPPPQVAALAAKVRIGLDRPTRCWRASSRWSASSAERSRPGGARPSRSPVPRRRCSPARRAHRGPGPERRARPRRRPGGGQRGPAHPDDGERHRQRRSSQRAGRPDQGHHQHPQTGHTVATNPSRCSPTARLMSSVRTRLRCGCAPLTCRRHGDIGTLTLARPGMRNAQNPPMREELARLGARLLPTRPSDAWLVTGEGPAFSAVIDLVEGMAGMLADMAERPHDEHTLARDLSGRPIPDSYLVPGVQQPGCDATSHCAQLDDGDRGHPAPAGPARHASSTHRRTCPRRA